MKPKPLSALNHFTKPVILLDIDTSLINEPLSVAMMACI